MSDEGDEKEPEPGSTEWLLAQLSGGRIDSRRERREAEAALEAAGVELPSSQTPPDGLPQPPATPLPAVPAADPPAEPSPAEPAPPAAESEERPKARFSWETGTLHSLDDGAALAPEPSQPEPAPAAASPTDSPAAPFLWHLDPTDEPDPAVNPHEAIAEPAPAEPAPSFNSAAPLVVPKPAAAPSPPAAPPVPPAPPVPAAAPAPPVVEPASPSTGVAAGDFDPFAQDLFNPHPEVVTPVPSVDEFTIPDAPSSGADDAAIHPATTQPDEEQDGHITSDWSDIADMFGAQPTGSETAAAPVVFAPVPSPPVPGSPVPAPPMPGPVVPAPAPSFDAALAAASAPPSVPARPVSAPLEHNRGGGSMTRWLIIVAAVLVAVLLAVVLFTLGRALATGNAKKEPLPAAAHSSSPTPSQTPTPTPTPSSTPELPPTGPLPAGASYQWDKLRGGECIDPFTTPWAQQFAVVDCNAQHAAQLVYTAPYSDDPAAAFPGEQAIASQINLLCGKPGVIDLGAAAAYSDIQIIASYPVTQEQWEGGERNYYCFADRSSGQQLSSSIAGPGPTQ